MFVYRCEAYYMTSDGLYVATFFIDNLSDYFGVLSIIGDVGGASGIGAIYS